MFDVSKTLFYVLLKRTNIKKREHRILCIWQCPSKGWLPKYECQSLNAATFKLRQLRHYSSYFGIQTYWNHKTMWHRFIISTFGNCVHKKELVYNPDKSCTFQEPSYRNISLESAQTIARNSEHIPCYKMSMMVPRALKTFLLLCGECMFYMIYGSIHNKVAS